MDLFKSKGASIARSEIFVELCIDDLVRDSVTWMPKSSRELQSTESLPNVIHGVPASSNLH
jgi:hypothetical protein